MSRVPHNLGMDLVFGCGEDSDRLRICRQPVVAVYTHMGELTGVCQEHIVAIALTRTLVPLNSLIDDMIEDALSQKA